MKPTAQLRFVERDVVVSHAQMIVKTVRILQQYWQNDVPFIHGFKEVYEGEWRDVPVESE